MLVVVLLGVAEERKRRTSFGVGRPLLHSDCFEATLAKRGVRTRPPANGRGAPLPPAIDPPLPDTRLITSALTGGPGEFAEEE
ncbi:hypothetical protein EYF80_037927 [Liparis tanakae]|uniref:Uncharacterized protein n=1 Tax=Liparis tanakae TaxID=230148 RepID=A0A4Z2GF22_9TELE|nr:hypothetical protein EYF80_037927 [Liparis tanakae]